MGIALTSQYQKISPQEDKPKIARQETSTLPPSSYQEKGPKLTWKQKGCITFSVLGWGAVTALSLYNLSWTIADARDLALEGYNKTYETVMPACRKSQICQICDVSIGTSFTNNSKLEIRGNHGCDSYPVIHCPDLNVTQALHIITEMKNAGYIDSFSAPRDHQTYYSWPAFGRYPRGNWVAMFCNRTSQALNAVQSSSILPVYGLLAAIGPTLGFISGLIFKGCCEKEPAFE